MGAFYAFKLYKWYQISQNISENVIWEIAFEVDDSKPVEKFLRGCLDLLCLAWYG